MGYTTEFSGSIAVDPPLDEAEIKYLRKFTETRRMNRRKGPYYVDGAGFMGQYREPDVTDYNQPPKGQPGLWCHWVPTDDGTAIEWDGGEKFYDSEEWMAYLIEHFIGSNPLAKPQLPFLRSHVLNGTIDAQGEESDDRWRLVVKDNAVSAVSGKWSWDTTD
jgi:hypothetical protein